MDDWKLDITTQSLYLAHDIWSTCSLLTQIEFQTHQLSAQTLEKWPYNPPPCSKKLIIVQVIFWLSTFLYTLYFFFTKFGQMKVTVKSSQE